MRDVEILHFHCYCGLGGGAHGFNLGRAELNGLRARFRCIGGIVEDLGSAGLCRGRFQLAVAQQIDGRLADYLLVPEVQ